MRLKIGAAVHHAIDFFTQTNHQLRLAERYFLQQIALHTGRRHRQIIIARGLYSWIDWIDPAQILIRFHMMCIYQKTLDHIGQPNILAQIQPQRLKIVPLQAIPRGIIPHTHVIEIARHVKWFCNIIHRHRRFGADGGKATVGVSADHHNAPLHQPGWDHRYQRRLPSKVRRLIGRGIKGMLIDYGAFRNAADRNEFQMRPHIFINCGNIGHKSV